MPKEEAREQAFWMWSKEFAVPRPNSSMVPIFRCSRNTRTRKVKTTRCLFASVKADGRKLLLTGFGTQVSGGIPCLCYTHYVRCVLQPRWTRICTILYDNYIILWIKHCTLIQHHGPDRSSHLQMFPKHHTLVCMPAFVQYRHCCSNNFSIKWKYQSNYYIPIPVYVKGYGHFMQTRGGSPPRPPHLSSYM